MTQPSKLPLEGGAVMASYLTSIADVVAKVQASNRPDFGRTGDKLNEGLGVPYHEVIGVRRLGVPTVRLECDFTAISRHGDRLRQRLAVAKLGRSSVELAVEFSGGGGELRARFRQVLVCTSLLSHKAVALPGDVRQGMQRYLSNAP